VPLCSGDEAMYLEYQDDYYSNDRSDLPKYFKDTSKKKRTVRGVVQYRCTRCGQYKPKSEYYKDVRVPCGIRNRCKSCYHKRV